ncbi:TPA: hypothetical protein N0F65_005973 [Lagenidium giganteum]|uniref:Serine hydrolase domain-containing protein n=1 Tax=Lagenidium giganteum TaxID=4803 RepID=A0AAV2Z9E7_9STRA|nr:TPA: hypothetical protein N0F65_005973 [Lagenidium giganteum]
MAVDATTLLRPMRLLCLHGWRTNKHVLFQQTAGLREALGVNTEFLFLDGTFPASGPAQDLVQQFYGADTQYYEWWDAVKQPVPAADGSSRYLYTGMERTIDRVLLEVERRGPIDALVGFSQGAGLASILTAHLQQQCAPVPWKACVCVSGFRPRSDQTEPLFVPTGPPIQLPSIHVIGSQDPMAASAAKLVDCYADRGNAYRVRFDHQEGHKFPTPALHQELYRDVARALTAMVRPSLNSSI